MFSFKQLIVIFVLVIATQKTHADYNTFMDAPPFRYGIKTKVFGDGSSWSDEKTRHNPYLKDLFATKHRAFDHLSQKLFGSNKYLPKYKSCRSIALPPNVEFDCEHDRCAVSCPDNYIFPNNAKSLSLMCIGGSWIIRDSEFTTIPSCQEQCMPPCQNNGICIRPGVCSCPEGVTGPLCQYKAAICASRPPVPKNSKITCTNNFCNVECMRGFNFADGSAITNIECKNGQWLHTKDGAPKAPDCEPICSPSCENGGKCISFNVCDCPRTYRGKYCQYSIAACNVTKTGFNGIYKCSYNADEAVCRFSCPTVPGISVEGGSLSSDYICNYSTALFQPLPLPKCIYPPNYRITSSSSSILSYVPQRGHSSYGMSTQMEGGKYQTEREYMLAMLALYKEKMRKTEWWSSEETITAPPTFGLYTEGYVNLHMGGNEPEPEPRPAMCFVWGGRNVKTFDGLILKTPLLCSHTLLTDQSDATFDIAFKSCKDTYRCAHTIDILWQGVPYKFENLNGSVRLSTPTKQLPIPIQLMGIKVVPIAERIQIHFESIDLHIDWDLWQYIVIHAGRALWQRVGGVCGHFDGDHQNDMTTRQGHLSRTVHAFTSSWRTLGEVANGACTMASDIELEMNAETCDQARREQAFEICEKLLSSEKLQDCMKSYNFEALLATCITDYCNCPATASSNQNPAQCNCDAVSVLAKECQFQGIELKNGWRNLEICPISCNYGRIYLACGPEAEPTCDTISLPKKGTCNEGCFCPEGTVQYKGACITQELCPCTMRGKEFKPDAIIQKQCNSCKCKSGQWVCSDESCGARCGAIGDPHYQTFDGKHYDFMGKCSYILLKTTNNISVEAENVACSGAISESLNLLSTQAFDQPACTKSITIKFPLKNGARQTIKLDQDLKVDVNGKAMSKLPKVLGNGEVLLREASSTFITIEFPNGVRIWWDGVSRVYIDLPASYREQTAGLCGTFNSNTEDDFLTPAGDIETSITTFADKWRIDDGGACSLPLQPDNGTPNVPHPCSTNPERRAMAEKHCDWLTDDVFEDCHWTVEPEQYYEDCIYDVCACKDTHAESCFCPILAAYGAECMRQGVQTAWRHKVTECALKCPNGQVYDECGDSCVRHCEDLAAQQNCSKECVEGCRCPHGEYLDEQQECVPVASCPCTYDAATFHAGYKEVRPGPQGLHLCTCAAGKWACAEASDGDALKYPPAAEMRAKCAQRPNAEFVKCAPLVAKTCNNMHEYTENLDDCTAGCVCIENFVLDAARDVCVRADNCSCLHSGRSYSDGATMREHCNECKCQSGAWKCNEIACESTCSVWGDSHFTTFDNYDFDFQGACDYVLAKGELENGDGFVITIQNVLCGTMGVTCSKSLEISLSGSTQDSLTLSADSSYWNEPDTSTIARLRNVAHTKGQNGFLIYKVGTFVVIEVVPLKLQIKWDEGTRVYVKLGSDWQRRVSGLCGNFNGNSMDDMVTPSQGLETSPLLFGHAWKTHNYCTLPTQPIDSCREHPEREAWAQAKCGILKSPVFKDCHLVVDVERYLKRCIYDTCACDQGGDCECLCTAVAAYAHACSQKNVHIRWRTPHFCPMQCDPHCAEYSACTPACPIETCDNFLDLGIAESLCNREHCMEGCSIKGCDESHIYLNDSYKECVLKSECKPICIIKEGITYYEGDITFMDACSTCRCSKKKEVCSGVPCAEAIPTQTEKWNELEKPLSMQTQLDCVRGWTRWLDNDTDPTVKPIRLNDEEHLPHFDATENIYGTCSRSYMNQIECRVLNTHTNHANMDENVKCDLQNGLACIGQCHDYEIRVFCECNDERITTHAPSIETADVSHACDATIAEYKEHASDCHKFLHCQPSSVSGEWAYVEKTCGEHMMFNPIMNICDHIATVMQIRPMCGDTSPATGTGMGMGIVEAECPAGQSMSDCANQCEHSCHYYLKILEARGLCQLNEHCRPGCVPSQRPDCVQLNKLWRDENTCVESDECPCMDKSDKYIQPHMVVQGEWETCQCIDNQYNCLPNKMVVPTIAAASTAPPQSMALEVFPSTLTPPLFCSTDRLMPVLQGDSPRPDVVFNASSYLSREHAPAKGRLYAADATPLGDHTHTSSWCASINDQMQYLEVSFEQVQPLFGIQMAGDPNIDKYVTLFKILYSHDGVAYHYLVDESEMPQLLSGPIDSRSSQQTLFKIPIEAKSIRIYPLKWHNSICMRVELLGCGERIEQATTTITTTTIESSPPLWHAVSTTQSPALATLSPSIDLDMDGRCYDAMGVASGSMQPTQVAASSIWQLPKPAKKPRLIDLLKLSSPIGWRPVVNTPNQYVEFDFSMPRNISGVITKGGPDGWVTGYKILFSKNKLIWNKILAPDGKPIVFPANVDPDTEVLNKFRTPVLTQYLRVAPTKWQDHINLRLEPLGCFQPYEIEGHVPELETPSHECHICKGVPDTNVTEQTCKCSGDDYWNGNKCIPRNLCPCVENFLIYDIGMKFENQHCEECVCVIGGYASCKPKKCPPCGADMRPVMTSNCFCKCEKCPKDQRLCPSSGDCIPATLWCNGVQDCTDDEDATCRDEIKIIEPTINKTTQAIVAACPEPVCPPNTLLKLHPKSSRKMSQMFSTTYSRNITTNEDGSKLITTNRIITSTEEFLPLPIGQNNLIDVITDNQVEDDNCNDFTCIPIPGPTTIQKQNESKSCADVTCPNGYNLELDMSTVKRGDCPKYNCILKPRKDDVCELNGQIITTFDGTELKYQICSNILARDISNSNSNIGWLISARLQCEDEAHRICKKALIVKDVTASSVLMIMPNQKINFNGFDYTIQQLVNSPIFNSAFIISQPGNTILIVSRNHGFWLSYDNMGNIKIGISSKYLRTVDGLCGYYNGIPNDDKRLPNGTLASSTLAFGEGWSDHALTKDQCHRPVCSLNTQKKALTICNTIKHPVFFKCAKAVNYKQFVSKCIETTCECLRATSGDQNTCKCNILQDFMRKCLTVNPDIQSSTWHVVHECDVACPAPLIHSDCYRRRCEPSCDSLQNDDCPIIPDMCFSGCYCPEGTVRKGDSCVPILECKNCVCKSMGSNKYLTYDRKSFPINTNCTYLLTRDIILPGVHTFQIYVTNGICPNSYDGSNCIQGFYILNGDHLIHMQRTPTNGLKILVDGFEIEKFPYKDTWIELIEKNANDIRLDLTDAHAEFTITKSDFSFSFAVPHLKYGSKMEGLCGNCDQEPSNDVQLNPSESKKFRQATPTLDDIVQSWSADEPILGSVANECHSNSPTISIPKCTPIEGAHARCQLILDANVFGKCHLVVDPTLYLSACKDICNTAMAEQEVCNILSSYAKECLKQGICIEWRTAQLCPYPCPINTAYHPCNCAVTCNTLKARKHFMALDMKTNTYVNTVTREEMCTSDEREEGCFCPEDMVLHDNKCVSDKVCIECDDLKHNPGDVWQKDKCTECSCNQDGVTECTKIKCLIEENICAEGYHPKVIQSDDECCPKYICVVEPISPTPSLCLAPLMPTCGPDQHKKQKIDTNGCPQYICECKPKDECEIPIGRELKQGEVLVTDKSGCCETQKIVCDTSKCTKPTEKCIEQFYELVEQQLPDECCPKYTCELPKGVCLVHYDQGPQPQKYLKNVGDKWQNPTDPCKHDICAQQPDSSSKILTITENCDETCPPGFSYTRVDTSKCCGECVQTKCQHDRKLYELNDEWKSENNCTTFKCVKDGEILMVTSTSPACPDTRKCPPQRLMDDGCCKYCKDEPKISSLTNCLPITLSVAQTVGLVKIHSANHGICSNKEPVKGLTQCVGSCKSGSQFNPTTLAQDKLCHCCSISTYSTISIKLQCEDGHIYLKDVQTPDSCNCAPCSDSMEYSTNPLIDVRLLSNSIS